MPLPGRAPEMAGRRRKRRARLAAGAVLVLLVALFGGWWASRGRGGMQYTTAEITRGDVSRAVTATGTVNPILTVIVGTAVSGIIQQLYCDYNTVVKVGQICAKIDPRPYQAVVDQDKAKLGVDRAQLAKDEASLAYAAVTNQRDQRLLREDSISADAADNAKSVYEEDEAQIGLDQATAEQDQANLAAAQVNLDYTNIVSPVNGLVVSRDVTMGQTVAASFQTPTLFLIATDVTTMEVDTNVSEGDIGGMKEGDPASFTVLAYPDRTFLGVVAEVRQSPQTVQNVVTYDVVVNVGNKDLALKPGMTASVRIVTDERKNVVRVPDRALRYAPSGVAATGSLVWLLRDGRPVAVPVVTGLDDDTNTEIVKGDVQPGDLAIIGERRAAEAGAPAPSPAPAPRL